jgi:two-component system, chemotaxis family, chemotaxis protein CheY
MEQSQHQRAKQPIVLIVDDNPAIRNVVAWSLQFGGFQPVEAANGLEAVNWMEQATSEQRYPSIILLDLAMPGMDGRAFLEWLHSSWRGRYPMPSVIIITAGHLDDKALIPMPAVKQIITKPFHVRDLLEVIRKWAV